VSKFRVETNQAGRSSDGRRIGWPRREQTPHRANLSLDDCFTLARSAAAARMEEPAMRRDPARVTYLQDVPHVIAARPGSRPVRASVQLHLVRVLMPVRVGSRTGPFQPCRHEPDDRLNASIVRHRRECPRSCLGAIGHRRYRAAIETDGGATSTQSGYSGVG